MQSKYDLKEFPEIKITVDNLLANNLSINENKLLLALRNKKSCGRIGKSDKTKIKINKIIILKLQID